MAKYKSIVVTNGGLALVAAAHSGDTIEFTAVKTGAGVYDGTEVLAEATDLKDLKQTMGITGITKDDNVIKIRAVLSNEGLDTAYKITELGLYAKDSSGNEVLYAIVIAETGMEDYLPAYADAPTGITMEMYIDATAYESGVTFQATVIAGIYATVEDLNDSVVAMQSSIMQEVNKKVNTSDIVDNLESTATDKPPSANQARVLKENIEEVASIAKGRNRARVFNTTDDMNSWLSDEANKGVAIVGDNLYIVALDVPDWWISEALEDADVDTGFYYKIAQLETQKVDLTTIENSIRNIETAITKELVNKTYNVDTPISINANTIHSFCAVTIPANSYAIVDFSANNRSSGNPTISIGTATDDINMTVYNRVDGVEQYSSVETTIFINNMSDTEAVRNIVVKSSTNISLQYVGVRGFTAPY